MFAHLLQGCKIIGPSIQFKPRPRTKMRIHIEDRFLRPLKAWGPKSTVIVPMRHPETTAMSWKARGKDLEELWQQYHLLKTVVDPWQPHYLPIDTRDRDEHLERLAAHVPELLADYNWPVILSCGKSSALTETELADVSKVMADGFFNRFYSESTWPTTAKP